ncbi:MAG: hypothetical protein EOO32_00150 [Comamonadaceae bacterium]|nr:MAG: hypothetical protein EOO32_00150 [Comamonadaceae bacterium]
MKKSLIALAVIAAYTLGATQQEELPVGAAFDAPDDIADKLIADGQARLADTAEKQPQAKQSTKPIEARLLIDGEHGRANDLVTLPMDVVKQLVKDAAADDSKAAVAYAKDLPQNQRRKT